MGIQSKNNDAQCHVRKRKTLLLDSWDIIVVDWLGANQIEVYKWSIWRPQLWTQFPTANASASKQTSLDPYLNAKGGWFFWHPTFAGHQDAGFGGERAESEGESAHWETKQRSFKRWSETSPGGWTCRPVSMWMYQAARNFLEFSRGTPTIWATCWYFLVASSMVYFEL